MANRNLREEEYDMATEHTYRAIFSLMKFRITKLYHKYIFVLGLLTEPRGKFKSQLTS